MKNKVIGVLLSLCLAVPTTALAAETAASPVLDTKAAGAGKENRPVRDKWALVIGISNFEKSSVPQLKFAAKDAKDFYEYLTKEANFAPDHVRLILNEKATRKRILSELGNKFLARMAKPDDLIVLYFSTHGSPSQLDIRGRNFIVAYDTEPEELYATGIEMQEIADSINDRVLSDRVLLVLDACHSGNVNPEGGKGIHRVGNFDAQAFAVGSGQMVICSSEPDQQSWESKRYNNGVFTKNLLAGLRSQGEQTSIAQAFNKTTDLVGNEVREDYPGMRQTPVLHSKWKGDNLLIAVKPAEPQELPQTVLFDLDPDSAGFGKRRPAATAAQPEVSSSSKQPIEPPAPEKPKMLMLTQSFFSNEKDPVKAYQSAAAAQAAHFNETEFYYRKAKIAIQLGKWAKAMQELKGCIIDNPQVAAYYLARAYCFHKMGDEATAQADLRTAKFLDVSLPADIQMD